ncbi:hypothetical protein ACWIF8_27620 [Micromonospora chalcea]
MRVDELATVVRRGLHRDLSEALMHPVLAHSLDQVGAVFTRNGHDALVDFHRFLYEPFERARRADPGRYVTFREFLLGDPAAREALERIVGPDYFILATEQSGRRYFDARTRLLRSLRYDQPAVAQWLAWGQWGRDPVTVDVFADMPGLLPVDFPQRKRITRGPHAGSERWGYPDWETGRTRLFQNLAYAELTHRLPDTAIPLDLNGPALLTALRLPHDPTPRPFRGMGVLTMSDLQVAQLLVEGRSPAYRSMLVAPGASPPTGFLVSHGSGGRAARDARWELAGRLDEPGLLTSSETRFEGLVQQHPDAADTARPVNGNPDHPVTTLSNAELVAVALYRHGCPAIAVQAFEVEHRRVQRMVYQLERLFRRLDQVVDADLLRHMCGLCDPHNLRVLTPEGHAAEDFFAAFSGYLPDARRGLQPARGNRWVPNRARAAALFGAPPPSPAPLAGLNRRDLVEPRTFRLDYDSHRDITRAMNGFFGFSPYYLEPVANLFRDAGVRRALGELFGEPNGDESIAVYNGFAGCLNAAMRAYGIDPDLMPPLLTDGSWR